MNSENRKTSEPHVLILEFTDKIDSQRGYYCFIKSQYLPYMEKYQKLIQQQ